MFDNYFEVDYGIYFVIIETFNNLLSSRSTWIASGNSEIIPGDVIAAGGGGSSAAAASGGSSAAVAAVSD